MYGIAFRTFCMCRSAATYRHGHSVRFETINLSAKRLRIPDGTFQKYQKNKIGVFTRRALTAPFTPNIHRADAAFSASTAAEFPLLPLHIAWVVVENLLILGLIVNFVLTVRQNYGNLDPRCINVTWPTGRPRSAPPQKSGSPNMVTTAAVVDRLRPHVGLTATKADTITRVLQNAALLPKGARGGKTRLPPLAPEEVLLLVIGLLLPPMPLPRAPDMAWMALNLRSPESSGSFAEDVLDGLADNDIAAISIGTAGDAIFVSIDHRRYGDWPTTKLKHIAALDEGLIRIIGELVNDAGDNHA